MPNQPPQYDFPLPQERTLKIGEKHERVVDVDSLRRVVMSLHSRINVLTGAAPNGVTFKGSAHMGGNVIDGGSNSAKPPSHEFATVGHLQNNYRAKGVTTGTIAASSSATVTLQWDTPFADGNYIPQAQVLEAGGTTASLRVHHVQSVAPGKVVVVVENTDSVPHSGTLFVTAQAT